MATHRVLDLFCGAGGASMGLHQAWPDADITGIDIAPQPHYPFRFVQADALDVDLSGYDFIWASPPCQAYSTMTDFKGKGQRAPSPQSALITPVRERLAGWGGPYTIENVVGAPLQTTVTLCGSMFGLRVRRHRNFETSFLLFNPSDHCRGRRNIAVYGKRPGDRLPDGVLRARDLADAADAMGIDWMDWREITQAIPPAYSRFIAEQFHD